MSGDVPVGDAERRLEEAFVVECERFLEGRFAEHLATSGGPVPAWAWLNLLAHGSEERLRIMSCIRIDPTTGPSWGRALARLADEVLAEADRERSLLTVQLSVLVPLELYLVARPEMAALGPDELVARVRAALHHHPSAEIS